MKAILIKLFEFSEPEEEILSYACLTVPQAGDRIILPSGQERVVYNSPRHILKSFRDFDGENFSLHYVRINLQ